MSYKLGLLLSLVYMISTLLVGGDIFCLIAIHNNLDAIALTVSYRIGIDGYVSEQTIDWIHNEGAEYYAVTETTPRIGDTFVFEIYKDYEPIIIKKSTMRIAVRRSTVVGFYEIA